MTVKPNDRVIILNSAGKPSVVPLHLATTGEKATFLNTSDGKGIAAQTNPVTVGGRVVVLPDSSGKSVAMQGTPPGETKPIEQKGVDQVEWMTCALYYADKRDIRIAWEPGDNNKWVFIAISTVRFPQTIYDGVIEWSAFTPAADRELLHRTIRYGQWQFITIWGVVEKNGEYLFSMYHLHCQVFSPVQNGNIDHYFKCYVTRKGVLDVDDITVSIGGGGYMYRTVIPAVYGGDYIACYGDAYTAGYPDPAEDCAIEVEILSSDHLKWTMVSPPGGDHGMWGTAAFAIRGINLGSFGFPMWDQPYTIHGTGILEIDLTVSNSSFWIYGDGVQAPNGEGGSGVRIAYSPSEGGLTGAQATFIFNDGIREFGHIAYRLIDPDNGVFEIWAYVMSGLSYAEMYFGDIFLCTNGNSYHGFLGLGNL